VRKVEILIFVSSHCPHCPKAVAIVKKSISKYAEHKIIYRKIRAKTAEGKILSNNYSITAYPTVILLDDNKNEIKRIVGIPNSGSLDSSIEKILGLKKHFLASFFWQ